MPCFSTTRNSSSHDDTNVDNANVDRQDKQEDILNSAENLFE